MLWAGTPAFAQQVERPRDSDYTEDAEDALDDADDADDDAERQQHLQEALGFAEQEIAANANNPLGYRLGALAALGLEQYEKAGEYFDRASELYPIYEIELAALRENAWIDLYQQAGPYLDSGDYEGAAVVFENAHAIYKARPEIMITLAQVYASIGELDKAIDFIDQVDAFMHSEVVENADEEAVAGWQEQAAGLPELKAQALTAAERFPEAVEAYEALLEQNPGNLDYQLDLAAIQMQIGNRTQALALYEDLLSGGGLTGPDLYAIGVGFYQADDYENAVRGFSQAAEQNEYDRDSIEMWARTLQLDSLFAEVPAVAERWVALDPYSQSGYAILAQAANINGDAETTQEAMTAIQGLEIAVDQLELQRFGNGGGIVNGTFVNKTLDPGATVTLVFTFYGVDGSRLGSTNHTLNAGAVDQVQSFQVQFDSSDRVGGYSYEANME
jgi:tetratricopeptide (TPR) repeat protein